MSRINGEKARAAITRKRRSAQRVKDRELRAKWMESSGVAPKKTKASVSSAEASAVKPKRTATKKTPDQLIEELRPARKRSGSDEKSE